MTNEKFIVSLEPYDHTAYGENESGNTIQFKSNYIYSIQKISEKDTYSAINLSKLARYITIEIGKNFKDKISYKPQKGFFALSKKDISDLEGIMEIYLKE